MLHFIVNESARSGGGAEIWKNLEQILKSSGIEYEAYRTEYFEHARELADQICALHERNLGIVAVGGDGTMNEVINGMHDFERVRFGMIPIGSGNDFGKGLGLAETPEENLRNILRDEHKVESDAHADFTHVDLGNVRYYVDCEGVYRERCFGISSGIGMDAIICKKVNESSIKKVLNRLHLGKLSYLVQTVITLFSMTTADAALELDGGRTKNIHGMVFAAAMNLRAEGGGIRMAPEATGDDRSLWVCACGELTRLGALLRLLVLLQGKHKKLKCITLEKSDRIHLKLSEPITLHADGENLGDCSEVTFTVMPGVLKMLGV